MHQTRLELRYHDEYPTDFVDQIFEIAIPEPKIELREDTLPQNHHIKSNTRLGIPLPGLSVLENHSKESHDSLENTGQPAEKKPRGLRRSYDTAIYNSYISDNAYDIPKNGNP